VPTSSRAQMGETPTQRLRRREALLALGADYAEALSGRRPAKKIENNPGESCRQPEDVTA
jgi:hypothetical protein